MELERRLRPIQRATVARSALDVIALIFLGCAFAFWGVAFWQLLAPPALRSLLSIQAVVLALVYALATPLLWSALVPTTPAGQLLQKTQWRTFGFAAIIASAVYLSYQAETVIELWLYAQQGIREAGFARPLAISLSIAFILIPALAWTQLSPERWVAAVDQAHQVRKLEMQQRGELAIIKASLVRAETLAAIGWANLLPLEQEEAVGTLKGLLMASSDTMRSVVRTLDLSSDLERSIMDDEAIASELAFVAKALNIVPTIEQPASAAPPPHPAPRAPLPPPRPAAPRRAPPLYAAEYETALNHENLAGMWSATQLGLALHKSERTARTWINVWEGSGLVTRGDTKGLFYFTESERT